MLNVAHVSACIMCAVVGGEYLRTQKDKLLQPVDAKHWKIAFLQSLLRCHVMLVMLVSCYAGYAGVMLCWPLQNLSLGEIQRHCEL